MAKSVLSFELNKFIPVQFELLTCWVVLKIIKDIFTFHVHASFVLYGIIIYNFISNPVFSKQWKNKADIILLVIFKKVNDIWFYSRS